MKTLEAAAESASTISQLTKDLATAARAQRDPKNRDPRDKVKPEATQVAFAAEKKEEAPKRPRVEEEQKPDNRTNVREHNRNQNQNPNQGGWNSNNNNNNRWGNNNRQPQGQHWRKSKAQKDAERNNDNTPQSLAGPSGWGNPKPQSQAYNWSKSSYSSEGANTHRTDGSDMGYDTSDSGKGNQTQQPPSTPPNCFSRQELVRKDLDSRRVSITHNQKQLKLANRALNNSPVSGVLTYCASAGGSQARLLLDSMYPMLNGDAICAGPAGLDNNSFLRIFVKECKEQQRLLKGTQCTWVGVSSEAQQVPEATNNGFYPFSDVMGGFTFQTKPITTCRPKLKITTRTNEVLVDNVFFWSQTIMTASCVLGEYHKYLNEEMTLLKNEFDNDEGDRGNNIPRHVIFDIKSLEKLRIQFENKHSPLFVHHCGKFQAMFRMLGHKRDTLQPFDQYELDFLEAWEDFQPMDLTIAWQDKVLSGIDIILQRLRDPYTFQRSPTWEDYEEMLDEEEHLTQTPISDLVAQARLDG